MSRVRAVAAHRCLVVVGSALLIAQSSWAQTQPASDTAPAAESLPSSEATNEATTEATTIEATTQPATQPASGKADPVLEQGEASIVASSPAAAPRKSAVQESWPFPVAALTCCAASSCAGLLLWLPVPAAGVLAVLGSRGFQSPAFAMASLMVAVLPFAGVAAAVNALAALIVVGITTAIDSSRVDRAWWPAVVGAAASALLFAAELGIGVTAFALPYLVNWASWGGVPLVALAAAIVASPLVAPLALAGALGARLLAPGPADDGYDLMTSIGSLVAAGGLLAGIGFGGGVAFFEMAASQYDADWDQKQQAAGWGVAMLAGLGVSLVALTGGSIAAGVGLIGQLPGGGEE